MKSGFSGWERTRADRIKRLSEFNAVRAKSSRLPIGTRIGTQTVVGYAERDGQTMHVVECDCGNVKEARKANLKRSKSCGCLTRKLISASRTKHGMTDTPTWKSWKSMIDRCDLKCHKSYADYGGRGVKVCPEWYVFENFLSDMGLRPTGYQLDRIDNDAGYERANCRWVTAKTNCNNRRSSAFLEYGGARKTVQQWADQQGILACTIRRRLLMGWSVADALTRPVRSYSGKKNA